MSTSGNERYFNCVCKCEMSLKQAYRKHNLCQTETEILFKQRYLSVTLFAIFSVQLRFLGAINDRGIDLCLCLGLFGYSEIE